MTYSDVGAAASNHTHDYSKVSFTRRLSSGTQIGSINIDGSSTTLYAPSNTDTHYTSYLYAGAQNASSNSAVSSGPYLTLRENNIARSSIRFVGSGATSVSSNSSGTITISSTDTNTHYTANLYVGNSGASSNAAVSNPYIVLRENNSARNSIRLLGAGTVSIASNSSGQITVTGDSFPMTFTKVANKVRMSSGWAQSTNGSLSWLSNGGRYIAINNASQDFMNGAFFTCSVVRESDDANDYSYLYLNGYDSLPTDSRYATPTYFDIYSVSFNI